ncbi:MAG: DUF1887 domain-containing protein [uncultured Thiotrichaceae bacterium]|uniref:DUF1887 domain-containing protein n=1 Tax=uncultured Thiotrichaceae bacterium TaxID=298394 RepID=A0A6S6TVY4_9GAMM|nr:MAG: DUF1887 domain-containing protein [uncultured Thiotrichaceae bacterium]
MTNTIHTHVYLVSAQATPNVTPALDLSLRPKRVILLVSKDMQARADWLEQVLKEATGVDVSRWLIDHPWDIEHIQTRMMELLEHYQNESLALNATGGTKPMSIAAYETFRAYELPIFYVHPEKDQVVWLYPTGWPRHELADRISIRHYLMAYGSQVLSKGSPNIPSGYQEIAEDLIRDIEYFSSALGVLNYFANTAERTLTSKPLGQGNHSAALLDLLDKLEAQGIIDGNRRRLTFSSEAARFFANGGWLEQYVLKTINALKRDIPEIQETAMSLEVERGKKVRNELDVAFLADNKLHVIECKAKNFSKPDDNSGVETLYKLDSLTDVLGGMQARSLLISYKPLRGADQKRAGELKVQVIQEKQLQQLRSLLRQWIVQGL